MNDIKLFFYLFLVLFAVNVNAHNSLKTSITAIPDSVRLEMQKYTWHAGCPVSLDELAYVIVPYYGFDKKDHEGVIIVHKTLALETADIFHTLFKAKFPIERIEPMYKFKGDDNAAMIANNTSAFNCREVTGQPGIFSQHSYGRAIDINTLINPYVKNKLVDPIQGTPFADRKVPHMGKITKGGLVYTEFKKRGWDWGGDWFDLQDFQHFEKRANGEKRNPYGYK